MPSTPEKVLKEGVRGVLEDLKRQVPEDCGFIVIMRNKAKNGRAWYAANVDCQSVMEMFAEVRREMGVDRIIQPAVG